MAETPRAMKRRRLNDSTSKPSPRQTPTGRRSPATNASAAGLDERDIALTREDTPGKLDSVNTPRRNGAIRQYTKGDLISAKASQKSSKNSLLKKNPEDQSTQVSRKQDAHSLSASVSRQKEQTVADDSERDELAPSSPERTQIGEAISQIAHTPVTETHSPQIRTSGRARKSTARALEAKVIPRRSNTKARTKRDDVQTASAFEHYNERTDDKDVHFALQPTTFTKDSSMATEEPTNTTKGPAEDAEVDIVEMDVDVMEPVEMGMDTANCWGTEFAVLKSIVLSKLSQRRRIPLVNLSSEYNKLHQVLHATITAGESNSMLLIGARGSGKTAMVNEVLRDLAQAQKEHFHTIRLNGFTQTDDKLALREIWRQLGREMEISDSEDSGGKSYADTLTMLLAVLSHPDEITGSRENGVAKSVIFVMDEFDLFASHARQTLLYNLLDIAQSRKAPIAVIGLTTRIDVTEALEKRVKSRFSHRYVHLALPKTLSEFVNVGKAAVKAEADELSYDERAILLGGATKPDKTGRHEGPVTGALRGWNDAVESFFTSPSFLQTIVQPIYYTTKSVPALFSSLLLTISSLSSLPTPEQFSSAGTAIQAAGLLTAPDSNLHLLPSLSELALALLIAAARLSIIHATDTTNFALAYAEYIGLASKARINSAASGALASGAGTRVFGKDVARGEWDDLIGYGLLVPVTSGAYGLGSGVSLTGTKGVAEMVRVDVALEEIPMSVDLGSVMDKWCRQI